MHVVPALFGGEDGGIVGGAERYALELARHMADEVETTLVTFGERERRETVGNLRVRVIGGAWHVRGQRTNPFAPALLKELRRADVVHCHQRQVVASSISALACRLSGRRVFVHGHGGRRVGLSAYVSTKSWYTRTCHSASTAAAFNGQEGDPRARVILGGVTRRSSRPTTPCRRNGHALFVGRLLPHKGVDDLVRALTEGMALELIGQTLRGRVRARPQGNCRREARHVPARLRRRGAGARLRGAMCVVLPSVYRNMYGGESGAELSGADA